MFENEGLRFDQWGWRFKTAGCVSRKLANIRKYYMVDTECFVGLTSDGKE